MIYGHKINITLKVRIKEGDVRLFIYGQKSNKTVNVRIESFVIVFCVMEVVINHIIEE